ncbi:Hypothetical_protein [Hexamita inflata]|uniref:Hypothetical_protein n=1 Tax=Hexamita inflata TaxID=28002 RepID=A0AA86PRH9_9EUKA|nr:Hypothetical protein HINF_LOCUS27459 [Hexamita inflata]CAI9939818.1 Hypothetical protein HINF_LOCUS27463 [Hexamita inflata]
MTRIRRSNVEQQLIDDRIIGILAQLCNVQSKPEVLRLYNQNQEHFNRSINWKQIDLTIGQKSHPTKSYSYRRFHDIIVPNSLPNFPVEMRKQIDNFVSRKFAAEFKADWSKDEMDAQRLALKNQTVKQFKLLEQASTYNYQSEVSRINHYILNLINPLKRQHQAQQKNVPCSHKSQNGLNSQETGKLNAAEEIQIAVSTQNSADSLQSNQQEESFALFQITDDKAQEIEWIINEEERQIASSTHNSFVQNQQEDSVLSTYNSFVWRQGILNVME